MEKILKITDTDFGYKIITDKQIIEFDMDMDGQCCEVFGYFLTEDNIDDFINSNLIDIELTDTLLNTKKYDKEITEDMKDELATIFVNINTSNGLLQFVAYNSHNGYYGHNIKITSNQLNYEQTL